MLVKAGLVPGKDVTRVTPIKMLCLNGHTTIYLRQKVHGTVQGVIREMPVGITVDLLYQMILDQDWPEIYEILEDEHSRGGWHQGLLEEGANEDRGQEEGAFWDLESITSRAQF